MTRIDTVSIALDAETQGFIDGMQNAGRIVSGQSTSIFGSLGKISQGFFYTTQAAQTMVAGAQAIYGYGKAIFDLGADADETASKFSATLGPATEQAQQFLERFAHTAGLTVTEGRELIATTAGISMGFGMGQTEAAKFSEEVLTLAGDMTSYSNIPIEETSRAIQSALAGERESLKRLGVVIRETDVQKRALEMTGKANAKQLNDEEKATATLALIQERAAYMAGNLEMTKDSLANTARRVGAEFREMKETLARALTPALGEVMGAIADMIGGDGLEGLTEAIVASRDQIAAWAVVGVEAFRLLAVAIWNTIQNGFELIMLLGDVGNAMGALSRMDFATLAKEVLDVGTRFRSMKNNVDDVIDVAAVLKDAIAVAMTTGKAEVEDFIRNINEADQQIIDMTDTTADQRAAFEAVGGAIEGLQKKFEAWEKRHGDYAKRQLDRVIQHHNVVRTLQQGYAALAPTFERAAKRIEQEEGMIRATVEAYEAAEDLMHSFRSMQAPIRQVTDALRDIGPGLDPIADAVDSFVDGMTRGLTATQSLSDAIDAFTTGGWSVLIDTGIGLLKDIFSSGGSANKRIDMIKMALDSNTRAVELNTDAMIKTITSGIGGGQLTGLLGLITEGIAQMREGEVDPETGRPLFDFFDFLRQGLADLGISWDQFMAFADQMGIDLSGGIPALEQFGKIIEGLIGKQLSDFASAWDNLLQQLDLRGVDAEGQIGSMIDFLKGQVGPELGALLDTLLGADPKEAGNIIADIIQNLREGGSLIGELGDIAIDEFIQALLSLFGIFGDIDIPEDDDPESDVEDAQRKFEGDEVNAAEEEAHKIAEQRWQAQEAAWAADRIAYDAMIREITDLKMSVTDLISTNRQGFEDVAVAARSA